MSHPARSMAMDAFIDTLGWGQADRLPLKSDASFRHYMRLRKIDVKRNEPASIMIMDAPPPREDVRPFMKIAGHLKSNGLSAPGILAHDTEAGFLALEDFGDDTFSVLLKSGTDEEYLYAIAVETLAAMHRNTVLADIDIGRYDHDALMEEVCLLVDWYYPEVTGKKIPEDARDAYMAAWSETFDAQPELPPVLVLRDFHVDNLMLLPGRKGIRKCGLLDFQDALIGSPGYDVASLLEDARRNIGAEFRTAMLERYLKSCGYMDKADFGISYAILSTQRHAKIIGIFTRLYLRDGKPHYLMHIPRVLEYLRYHLENPVLATVRKWFDNAFPDYLELPGNLKARKE